MIGGSEGFMTLRQPIALPDGFCPRASMSCFLYNQNGQQAIARLLLDGVPTSGTPGTSPLVTLQATSCPNTIRKKMGLRDECVEPEFHLRF
jgi:hypothetical protein